MSDEEARWAAVLQEVQLQARLVAKLRESAEVQAESYRSGVTYKSEDVEDGFTSIDLVRGPDAWQQQQWQNAYEVLFFATPSAVHSVTQQDDLLFFAVANPKPGSAQLFVRRKSKHLPEDLALGQPKAAEVDWQASVMLNIVLQTTFELTVAQCDRKDVGCMLDGDLPQGAYRVCKQVFASPAAVQVNLDASKPEAPQPLLAYPNICFSVDDFQSAFQSLVLQQPGQAYVVFLSACHGLVLNPWFTDWQTQHAQHSALDPRTLSDPADTILSSHAGPTASTPASTDPLHPPSNPLQPSSSLGTASAAPATIAALSDGSSSSSHVQPSTSSHRAPEQQLFAGYVSYEQLENCLGPGGSERKLSLWPRLVASESQTPVQYSVRMNGPGGRGHCLVAITAGAPGPPPEAREAAANAAPAKPLTLGQRLLKARSMARSAAGIVKAVGMSAIGEDRTTTLPHGLHLRCALMTLSLPVDAIAAHILLPS